jgi:intracellular multiplication protein IcmJ
MKYYPIMLGVVRPNWNAVKTGRAIGRITPEATQAIFERDDHTCQCCGFRAEKHQQVLHKNGDTRDFSDDNVLTTCIFCHQCFDLAAVDRMHSGMLIWLPEIAQHDLHHLMRALYVARVTQGPLADMARQTFDALYARGEEAQQRIGSKDPGALALVMKDFLAGREYHQTQDNLKGIRLLPLDRRMIKEETGQLNLFPQILAHWRSKTGPFGNLPAQEWPQIFKDQFGDKLGAVKQLTAS